jgi:hypothetical protein
MLRYLKIVILLLLTAQFSAGQKLVNSPYARFGPGLLEPAGTFKSLSMGRTGVADSDPLNISYQNPASYASLDTNSFVFDFGFDYRIIVLSDASGNYKSDDMNFHHLIMGFPIGKNAGFATGIIPYSSGYYNLSKTIGPGDPGYDPIIGETVETHKGTGGFNKFFFGFGINPFGGLSLGANMTFLFGELERSNGYSFLDDNNTFDNISTESVRLQGFNFDLGLQYKFDLKNGLNVTTGVKYSNTSKYKGQTESMSALFTSLYTGTPYSIDTLSYASSEDEPITLPGSLAFGVALGKKDKFMVTAEYSSTDWSKAVYIGHDNYFVKSNSINFGGEIIPDKFANFNFLNRVAYRFGGHITDSHIMVNGEQLKEFGITFGVGLPLKRSNSRTNLYFEYGQRGGSFDLGLHKETYYNFGISFNFYDYWFIKRKYD